MTRDINSMQGLEPRFQIVGKVSCLVACLLGLIMGGRQFVSNAALLGRLEVARADEQRSESEGESLEKRIGTTSKRVERMAAEVAVELEQKRQLHIAMAEVLARAKTLQEQRDHFDELRGEILNHLKKMDEYYSRGAQQTIGIHPQ